jgi:putative ABC transport system permease protein
MHDKPPYLFIRFFRWYCHPKMRDYIEGDLMELYTKRCKASGKRKANLKFMVDVLLLCRPGIIRPLNESQNKNTYAMLESYFKIGWRNLLRNKGYSFINIGGLTVGMAVAMLIGLWINDELSFNKYHQNYDRIGKVLQNYTLKGETKTGKYMSFPLGPELKKSYPEDFKNVVMSTFPEEHTLAYGEKKLTQPGQYMQPEAPEMFTLKMLHGGRDGLKDPHTIFISSSFAKSLFATEDPINKVVQMDNQAEVKVTGVYEDLPTNTDLNNVHFIAPLDLYLTINPWMKNFQNDWNNNMIQVFVQIAPNTSFEQVSAKIKDVKLKHSSKEDAAFNPQMLLHPMKKWHLYSEFKNGLNSGGQIQFVWLFGIIGIFVLVLACINFMNLSTARSETRAKEVGIRKVTGSARRQLITQFFSESFLVVSIAFFLALLLLQINLPFFNEIAGKKILVEWADPLLWSFGLGFGLFTCLIAGSYPALYLSSFRPAQILKGTFRAGRSATTPRKVLVVLQFTVSISLIIGTVIVFQQIAFTKNRPMGYNSNGLIYVTMKTNDIHDHYDALRNDLLRTEAIVDMAESNGSVTEIAENTGDFVWSGKDPNMKESFGHIRVSLDYGKTIGWEFKEGRDFSRSFVSDSSALVINESAAKLMGLPNLIGETIRHDGRDFKIIGIVKDMVMKSPYEPARQSVFSILRWRGDVVSFRINPTMNATDALSKIETVFSKYAPAIPFDFKFAEQEYDKKFSAEERIGKLSSIFAVLAIFISCLGIFGLSSFMAEQRSKEIGVRKVLGATILNLWKLLSKDFLVLVIVSCFIAIPIASYFLHQWLEGYVYRTQISWWVFAATGIGALMITLLTVSFQAIKAASANPVKSLKSE